MLRISVEDLRCPATREPLQLGGDSMLRTADGRHSYPIADGVPVLVSGELSAFSPDQVLQGAKVRDGGARSAHGFRRVVGRFLPAPRRSLPIGTADRYQRFEGAMCDFAGGRRPRVLVVGGGQLGTGMEPLATSPRVDLVETDVYLGPRVAVVCDGHHLPFADASFDGVVVQAVLEHVLDPQRVVAEIHRVLRDDAFVYAETPFMQQVHEAGFDFTRWTEIGHRRLFRMFSEVERGIVAGPATALLWSLCYFARSLPPRRTNLVFILDRLVLLMFGWLKYLDRILVAHPGAVDAASCVFFMGRKASVPISDAEVIAGYSGAIPIPVRV